MYISLALFSFPFIIMFYYKVFRYYVDFSLILENMTKTVSNNTTIYSLACLDLVSTAEAFMSVLLIMAWSWFFTSGSPFCILTLNPLLHVTADTRTSSVTIWLSVDTLYAPLRSKTHAFRLECPSVWACLMFHCG